MVLDRHWFNVAQESSPFSSKSNFVEKKLYGLKFRGIIRAGNGGWGLGPVARYNLGYTLP